MSMQRVSPTRLPVKRKAFLVFTVRHRRQCESTQNVCKKFVQSGSFSINTSRFSFLAFSLCQVVERDFCLSAVLTFKFGVALF